MRRLVLEQAVSSLLALVKQLVKQLRSGTNDRGQCDLQRCGACFRDRLVALVDSCTGTDPQATWGQMSTLTNSHESLGI